MDVFDKSGDGALQLDEFVTVDRFRNQLESLAREEKRLAYEAALRTYNDLQQGKKQDEESSTFNWIHVGDDLANDVGTSAACGAKAIWFQMEDEDDDGIPMWSTATKEEREKREALDQMAKKHVSASICSLKDLPDAIVQVLKI